MRANWKDAKNVLMTCAMDEGSGGVQVVFRDLIRWLEKSGRHVHLIYPAPLGGARTAEKVNTWGRNAFYCAMPTIVKDSALLSIPLFLAYLPVSLFHLTRWIRKKKIDVINCHYLSTYFVHLVIAARLLRVPVVVSVHGADVDTYGTAGWMHRLLFRLIVRGANRIVACSAALAQQTIQVFPDARSKVTWVHNGLDLSRYSIVGDAQPLPKPFILCVCRHVHKKGVDTLLYAFQQILRDAPDMSLVFVGDGPLLPEHRSLAERLHIASRVVFMGEVTHAHVSPFFENCAVLVLPSRAEPFGMVVLEAAYYSKPIVGTCVGGVPEIITNGVDGLLVAPNDPAGLASQILTLLRSPEMAERLGVRAHQTLIGRFLWKDRIRDYLDVFEGRRGPSLDQAGRPIREISSPLVG